MKPYFYTCLFISFVGSLLNCVYWYIDLVNQGYYRQESDFSFGFDFFISLFVIALFLSFFSSLIVTTIIWLFESRNGNRFLPICTCFLAGDFFHFDYIYELNERPFSPIFYLLLPSRCCWVLSICSSLTKKR